MSAPRLDSAFAARSLRVSPVIDEELEWFFCMSECDMGLVSNYCGILARTRIDYVERTPEEMAEASHAQRTIRRWLLAIPDSDAGVLQAAYETRTWPRDLRDQFGRLTGVVVRLSCARDFWPDDRPSQELLEMTRAGWLAGRLAIDRTDAAIRALRTEADVRFLLAAQAYATVRRPGPSVLETL
jgi:hypothetical protein